MPAKKPAARPHSYVEDPGRIRAMAAAIRAGTLSPVELVQRYLARIAAVDPHVEAWRVVDGERALKVAAEREKEARSGAFRGALHGIPIGVKDIIDVEGLPTRCNSRSRADAPPATADAEIVLSLKAQGAVVLGKLHTTEFAFFDPSPARNPHNINHTPGGSSSGSGAAVAAGMVPLALGSQTVASGNRPAAYCGISCFKPSSRSLSTFGAAPLAASYDTLCFYGWSIDDAVLAFEVARPAHLRVPSTPPPQRLRIVEPVDAHLDGMADDMRRALAGMAERMRAAGHIVEQRPSPIDFGRLLALQRASFLYEMGRAHAALLKFPKGQIGEKLTEAISDGQKIDLARYGADRAEIDRMRETFFAHFADADAFLYPAAPTTAPEGLASTGDPRFIAPWTALGGPIVTLPAGSGANGMPLGVLFAAAPGRDMDLAAMARRMDSTPA